MPSAAKKLRADRAQADAHRGLARARAFEHVAQIALAVLQRAGVVGVAGTRIRQRLARAGDRIHQRAHLRR